MGTIHILIIDDSHDILFIYEQALLRFSPYKAITSASGKQGITLARERKPDLILLDSLLDDLTGEEVCRQLKSDPITSQIPVVLLSSLDPSKLKKKMLDSGAQGFMQKTSDPNSFVEQVTAFLNQFSKSPDDAH